MGKPQKSPEPGSTSREGTWSQGVWLYSKPRAIPADSGQACLPYLLGCWDSAHTPQCPREMPACLGWGGGRIPWLRVRPTTCLKVHLPVTAGGRRKRRTTILKSSTWKDRLVHPRGVGTGEGHTDNDGTNPTPLGEGAEDSAPRSWSSRPPSCRPPPPCTPGGGLTKDCAPLGAHRGLSPVGAGAVGP